MVVGGAAHRTTADSTASRIWEGSQAQAGFTITFAAIKGLKPLAAFGGNIIQTMRIFWFKWYKFPMD